MDSQPLSGKKIIQIALSRFVLFLIFMGVLLFLPAGSFRFWQAWGFLVVLFVPILFVGVNLYQKDRGLLERRLRLREKESAQKILVSLSWIYILICFILPGLDYRIGWSLVPVWLVVLAYICILAGYALVVWVFRTNSYASRIIEVDQGQRVVDSGPYAIVRHPMYLGTLIMYLFFPLALGSFWTLIPASLILPFIVIRLLKEETVLARDLPGYTQYMEKIRYHLVPGIW